MATQINGNPTGPVYSLGLITVTTAGTPVALSTGGSSLTGGFGTTNSPSPIVCHKIRVHALKANTGLFYLVFKGGTKATSNNIALAVEPGTTEELSVFLGSNPFKPQDYNADADTSADAAYVTLVIV